MKLQIYTVGEKSPPTNEDLIKWDIASDGEILEMRMTRAYASILEHGDIIEENTHPTLNWGTGWDMLLTDYWSSATTNKAD